MQQFNILEGAEEFALGEGRTGALLVHGFTGSPQSMRPLGEYLGDHGVSVVGLRLPGHGTTWQDLNTRRSEEWVETVEAEVTKMEQTHDDIFIVGLSFGVALMMEFAARNPGRAAGLVSLAGFLYTPDPRARLVPIMCRVLKSMPGVANDICDPDSKELAYDRFPLRAADAMFRFCNKARADLSKVVDPVLVIHSPNDHTAVKANATMIIDNVSSTDKELVWAERSYHVITLDYDRDMVYERTLKFIKERAKSAV
ncbi:MAG: alpha/beta hydrolase [Actinomycetota bacterium]